LDPDQIVTALRRLQRARPTWADPYVSEEAERSRDPFRVLVSCILSLRTRDETTAQASRRLFRRARSPRGLLRLEEKDLARTIYPVGFYRQKARQLQGTARALLDRHGGKVPSTMEDLLALPGVGRKTANLVLTMAFGKDGICVDTHVHRIPNRWGAIETRTPEQTERALREILPRREWIPLNDTLVAFGQTLCKPLSPLCSLCPIEDLCPRIGVERSR